MWKYVLAWAPMIVIAIVNGLFRENILSKKFEELQAHQLSTASAIVLFGIYIWFILRVWKPESAGQAWSIGLMWLGLTVAFEFVFGHYVAGHSWNRLLHDYNLLEGRVWVFVLIWVTMAPIVFYQFQK